MAGSRKAFLKKISPNKGTGRYLEYVRCPVCGKLARGLALGNAGSHVLSVSKCTGPKGGYRGGFNWEHIPPTPEILGALKESLEAALVQVNGLLGVVGSSGLGAPAIPALVGVMGWENVIPEVLSYDDDEGESQGQGEAVYPCVHTQNV